MSLTPLNYKMIKNALHQIDRHISTAHGGHRSRGQLRVIITGAASAILSEGDKSKDICVGLIELDVANSEDLQEFCAAKEAVAKVRPHADLFAVHPLSTYVSDCIILYGVSVRGPAVYAGVCLAAYAADWDFQLAKQIREAVAAGATIDKSTNSINMHDPRERMLRQANVVFLHVLKLRGSISLSVGSNQTCIYHDKRELILAEVEYILHEYHLLGMKNKRAHTHQA